MKYGNAYIIFPVFLATLLGCRKAPGAGGECAGAQSLLSSQTAVVDTEAVVPAGGFLHVGSKACTATFLLEATSPTELRFNAYTAQHCINEESKSTDKFAVSVHIPGDKGSGYVQKIPVTDDFFSRRNNFWAAVRELGSNEANELAESALLVPGIGEYLDQAKNDAGETEGGREDGGKVEAKNVCLSNRTDLLDVGNSQHLCWSTLDTTVRRLTLRASDVNQQSFAKLKQHFEQRKAAFDSILRNSPQISQYFTLFNNRLNGQVGGWRLANYTNIAAFLNNELCGKYLPKEAAEQSICQVRDKFRALAEKHLIEVDIDGRLKTSLTHAEQLGLGTSTPFFVDGIPLKTALPVKATEKFFKFLNSRTEELRKFFPVSSNNKLLPLPKQFAIASNASLFSQNEQKASLMFGLIKPEALFGETKELPSKGVGAAGLLRTYVSKQKIQVQFGSTDSGAMITFAGIVPLLVLNTVDDKPTSGGSAILALPEIGYEDESGASQANNRTQQDQNIALNSSIKSDEAIVKYGNGPCY